MANLGPTRSLLYAASLAACLWWGGCGGDDGGASQDTAAPDLSPDISEDDSADGEDVASVDGDIADGSSDPDGSAPDGDSAAPPDTSSPPDTTGPEVLTNGYPAEGLLIRITSPGGNGTAASVGAVIQLGGLLFGEADSIVWTRGSDSGAAPLAAFWRSGPISLDPGDNVITVTASRGDVSTSDSITVTYNPAFAFDDGLLARPKSVWKGEATDISFTIPTTIYSTADRGTVRLLRVDAKGNQLASVGAMVDDGRTSTSGDEIEGDGIFTRRDVFTCTGEDAMFFRASVAIDGAVSYAAVSPTVRVDCVERISSSVCNSHKALVDSASEMLAAGSSLDDVVAHLLEDPSVKAAGKAEPGGNSAWLQFHDGILGAVLGTAAGKRGAGSGSGAGASSGAMHAAVLNAPEIGSKRAIVLAPFSQEFGDTDDGVDVANAIANSECPNYDLEGGTVLQGGSASLARFRRLNEFGIASISTHGEALFGDLDTSDPANDYRWSHRGPQEVIWSGSPVNCGQFLQSNIECAVTTTNPTGGCPSGSRCLVTESSIINDAVVSRGVCADETQVDLRLGRVAITNRGYAILPSFFTAHRGRGFPQSLINLGACRTLYNGSLASALYASGVLTITGFSDHVESAFARSRVISLFDRIGEQGLVGDFFEPAEDPDNPGAAWRLFGASSLNLANDEIINGDFETGDTTGWGTTGDGRVVAQLGSSQAVSGKFMGLVSTGLGFTVQTGTLEQTFCIPEDKVSIEIFWKFFSEEFKEFCGSQFQDTFQAELVGDNGEIVLVDAKVDDLCGYEDGSCDSCSDPIGTCDISCAGTGGCMATDEGCVGVYNCNCGRYFTGLEQGDISFDQGGVFNITWKRTEKNIQALAGGGPVTLRLFATDTGDSIYDTAILIDRIQFK